MVDITGDILSIYISNDITSFNDLYIALNFVLGLAVIQDKDISDIGLVYFDKQTNQVTPLDVTKLLGLYQNEKQISDLLQKTS